MRGKDPPSDPPLSSWSPSFRAIILEKIENLNLPKGGEKMSGTFIPPQKDRGKARGNGHLSFRKSRHLTLATLAMF